jgi:hypothetical protein
VTSRLALLLAAALASGCASQSLYAWGHYEDLLHARWIEPGSADPATQIARLREDVDRAAAAGRRVPPGVWAHLGYLHWVHGDAGAAREALGRERALFPESAAFVDGLLRRMDAS